jgi:hypothetical protein
MVEDGLWLSRNNAKGQLSLSYDRKQIILERNDASECLGGKYVEQHNGSILESAEGLLFRVGKSTLLHHQGREAMVGMLHDFAVYRNDPPSISQALPGTRSVLRWFANFQSKVGLLRQLPEWSFVDWTTSGVTLPPYDAKGKSCLLTTCAN